MKLSPPSRQRWILDTSEASKSVDKDLGHSLAKLKADKREFQEGITLFNKKAKKGLAHLQSIGRLGESFDEIAEFLRRTPGLIKPSSATTG